MALPSHSLATDVFTLPERLAASGYRTYLTTAIPTAEMPLRGRVHSRTVDQHAPASKLVDDLLQWWTETDDSPRFGYVHFGDLHEPLKQPNREPFGKIPNVPGISRWRFTTSTEPREQFETYRRERIRLYDTLLRGVDRQIARFHRTLTERGEDNNTIIVVTGDHGEEFWEWVELERERFHDPRGVFGVGHGHSLVPEVVDVPLVTIGARNAEPRSHVSTVDIVPTLLHELGHPYDQSSHFDGVPIGKIPEDRPVLAEEVAYGYDQQAVVCGDFHLIHSPHEEETLLLDRSTGELLPDAEIIEKFVGVTEFDRQKGAEISVNQKVKQQLSDLGYR